ncbi:hypothetical protein Tco_1092349 [Tanacetum coccineum]|uniref:Uncharacterized protein n=1 Tax=Tanacetum coccineum TaxID=301880 RepID=A0ABQ5I9P8_9ASTR
MPDLSLSTISKRRDREVGVSNQVADALVRIFKEEEEATTYAFMALSHPIINLLDNLKRENETLEELCQIHNRLDKGEIVAGFRREHGLLLFRDRQHMALPPRDQRHQYLRFEGLQYTDTDIMDFEERLDRIYNREVYSLAELEGGYLRLEACWLDWRSNIAGRSQAPEKKVTETIVLSKRDVWRKHGAMISGGLPVIDMGELVKLQIFEELNDTWDWAIPTTRIGTSTTPAARPSRTIAQRFARVEERYMRSSGIRESNMSNG